MRFGSFIAVLGLLAGCQGTFGEMEHRNDDHAGDGPSTLPIPACPVDPDCAIGGDCSIYECPDYWECEYLADGRRKRCTNPGPDYPDSSNEWDCEDVGGQTVCRGQNFPDGGGDGSWNCERSAEFVVCTSDNPSYPDDGSEGPWNCWFEGEFRVCESGGGPGDGGGWTCYDTPTGRECRQRNPRYPDDRAWDCYDTATGTVCETPGDVPDGGGSSGWDCVTRDEFAVCTDTTPDYPDGGDGGDWICEYEDEFRVCRDTPTGPPDGGDSLCVPGVQRWCDDHTYCSWGKQTCRPDGTWGTCVEPTVTDAGLADRPATECACRYFYFNYDCCEDQADRDGDGNADCIIPSGHTPPVCPTDGSLCASCDSHGDCGGASDLCLFRRDGYALCGRHCTSDADCPGGYSCNSIRVSGGGTLGQCAPNSGTCG